MFHIFIHIFITHNFSFEINTLGHPLILIESYYRLSLNPHCVAPICACKANHRWLYLMGCLNHLGTCHASFTLQLQTRGGKGEGAMIWTVGNEKSSELTL